MSIGLIWVLALGAMFSGLWVVIHLSGLPGPLTFAPVNTFIVFFSDRTLGAIPGLFPLAIWTYAVAVAIASTLAMVLSVRAAQIPAAVWLSGALSGGAFFAAQFIFVHHIPQLATTPLVRVGDYLAMAALAFGSWVGMRVPLYYPRPMDVDAYSSYTRKKLSLAAAKLHSATSPLDKLRRHLFVGRTGQVDPKSELLVVSAGRGWLLVARSPWWPCGLMALGWMLVGFWHSTGPAIHDRNRYIFLSFLIYPLIVVTAGGLDFFDYQYRTGRDEDKARIAWLVVGLSIAAWLPFVPIFGLFFWVIFGVREQALYLAQVLMALAPPVMAMVLLLLLCISIFFFGAFDPRMAIRKTSVYGVAALLIAVAMAVAQGTAATQLMRRLGLPGGSGQVAALVMVSLVFAPLRRRIESGVERVVERVLPASALAEAHRETVTVVFGDMSGYTALSVRDESTALTLASLLHKESRRLAERHDGRLVKTIGDAVLLSFRQPGEAILACVELREKFAVAASALKLPVLPLHFGVHLGEVVRDQEGDIFGGTVNLAARLQGVAGADEIVASEAVTSALTPGSFTVESIGTKSLKNVPVPVPCFRVS